MRQVQQLQGVEGAPTVGDGVPQLAQRRRTLCRSPRRAAKRGFTMMELLAVLVIIGILAAVASPSFVDVMRDRRVNRSAQAIAELYRMGRARSMGRGGAVMVRWNSTGGTGSTPIFEVFEAITSTTDAIPVSSCLVGFSASGFSQRIAVLQPTLGYFSLAGVTMVGGVTRQDTCFTPRGRTFQRNLPTDAFTPMLSVSEVNVVNTKTSVNRRVFIPPNGVARLLL
ncbi:MAG: prepilin-type N-terminal cleavage/methylation domain-containing protein [Polyangiaceae bacterium]